MYNNRRARSVAGVCYVDYLSVVREIARKRVRLSLYIYICNTKHISRVEDDVLRNLEWGRSRCNEGDLCKSREGDEVAGRDEFEILATRGRERERDVSFLFFYFLFFPSDQERRI